MKWHCFSGGFWSRTTATEDPPPSWFSNNINQQQIVATILPPKKNSPSNFISNQHYDYYHRYINNSSTHSTGEDDRIKSMAKCQEEKIDNDLRDIVKIKAEKHKNYFRNLLENVKCETSVSKCCEKMAKQVPQCSTTSTRSTEPVVHVVFGQTGTTAIDKNVNNNKNIISERNDGTSTTNNNNQTTNLINNEPTRCDRKQRQQGVYEFDGDDVFNSATITIDSTNAVLKSVKQLREEYATMLATMQESSTTEPKKVEPLSSTATTAKTANRKYSESDGLLLVPPQNDYYYYSSSGTSDDERSGGGSGSTDNNESRTMKWSKETCKRRYGSSDSAMGHSDDEDEDDEEAMNYDRHQTTSSDLSKNIPSRTLIEAQCVLFPISSSNNNNNNSRKFSVDCTTLNHHEDDQSVTTVNNNDDNSSISRRQSCFTDDGDDEIQSQYRYWRTPSVVVSDYSDDVVMGGLTLEDIEYIRDHQKRQQQKGGGSSNNEGGGGGIFGTATTSGGDIYISSPESSIHSSCSNLNYCGSTISGIESDFILSKPYRKSSNCSTCSTISCSASGGGGWAGVDGGSGSRAGGDEHDVGCEAECVNGGECSTESMRLRPKCSNKYKEQQNKYKTNTSPSGPSTAATSSSVHQQRPKSLMENLLMAKMEKQQTQEANSPSVSTSSASKLLSNRAGTLSKPELIRTDSIDSCSSMGSGNSLSTANTNDICHCDDCLLGIADLYAEVKEDDEQKIKKKKSSGWRKLRNIVQWTPFFQTYKKHRYPWVQLAGHQGNFKAGPDQGTILKKLCVKEEKCFQVLMKDALRPFVPEYKGLVASDDGESEYIQLQDLLGDFISPCVMDCKIGVRTYLEEELAKAKEKPKLRKDMYDKMCQIDQHAPSDEEHKIKGVTKPRYMVWRETISSTATLGFRIEGIRNADGTSSKDFKTTKTKDQIIDAFIKFTDGFPHAVPQYIQRLKSIKATLEASRFFETHEVIGSSLLFVHDHYTANIWLIDFAKTIKLPNGIKINHTSRWKVGNHEDGYMIGITNLISIFMAVLEFQPISIVPPLIDEPSALFPAPSPLIPPTTSSSSMENNNTIKEFKRKQDKKENSSLENT